MPKHFLKCDLVKTTPFDKEPLFLIYFFQYFYKYKKTRLSLQKGVFLRPSIRRIGSLTNCPFKRYSLNELFVF